MNPHPLRPLWDDHARTVYAYLLRLTKNPEEARDHLQELFHRLARQPEIVSRLNGDARGFLLRLARNGVVDQARRNQARERIFEKINAARTGECIPAADPDLPLIRGSLEKALRQLPSDQRHVMIERLWKKRTLDEIAASLGVSINTVASRYRYGLDKMREALRSLYEDLATRPPAKPSNTMKDQPLHSQPETPIIQPLEQRRVPSATGAAFALPVVPVDEPAPAEIAPEIAVCDLAVFEIAPEFEPEIAVCDFGLTPEDLNLGDEVKLAVEEFVDGSVEDGELPITFEEVIGEDAVPVDPALEDMIFWSFAGEEVPSDGEGEVFITEVTDGEFVKGDFVVGETFEGEVTEGEFTKGEPVDGEVVDGEVVYGEAVDGEVVDGEVGEGEYTTTSEGEGAVPIDWVKRTNAETEEVESIDPQVLYMSGAPDQGKADVGSGEPEPTAAESGATPPQTPEPLAAPAASAVASTPAATPFDLEVVAEPGAAAVVFPLGPNFGSPLDLQGIGAAELAPQPGAGQVGGDFVHSDLVAAGIQVELPEVSWSSLDAVHGQVAGSQWIPLDGPVVASVLESSAPGVNPVVDVPATPQPAGMVDLVQPATPASSAAMAATGAILAGNTAAKRERKRVD